MITIGVACGIGLAADNAFIRIVSIAVLVTWLLFVFAGGTLS